MILYLSSEKNTNLLDFWIHQGNGENVPLKKMVGTFTLKKFVVYDMRSFAHLSDVVLDRTAFHDEDIEFAEAIEEFLTMYQARITVIYEGLDDTNPLFPILLNSGVGNLVCNTEIRAIQQEISECLSQQGMVRYLPNSKADDRSIQYEFACQNVRIAMLSSQPRIGTTTAAMGFSAWLGTVGASVCYIEANQDRHLDYIAKSYSMEIEEQGYFYENVWYQRAERAEAVNFIIYDIGKNSLEKQALLENADILVVVCGIKPYELKHTLKVRQQIKEQDAYLLFPFVAEESRADVISVMENECHKILFLEYQPELTNGISNAETFKSIVLDYITGIKTASELHNYNHL